jgi:hypothetical protein
MLFALLEQFVVCGTVVVHSAERTAGEVSLAGFLLDGGGGISKPHRERSRDSTAYVHLVWFV